MKSDSLLTWDFKPTTGGAIYSLADEDGRRYVGQTKNLLNRLRSHRTNLNYAHKHPTEWFLYNQKLIRAARDGMHFKAECLRELPQDASESERNFWERYYINKFGGIYLSYNINPAPYPGFRTSIGNYRCDRYVLKEEDARAIESCEDARTASELLDNVEDYIYIDDSLIRAMAEIPSGLKTLVG